MNDKIINLEEELDLAKSQAEQGAMLQKANGPPGLISQIKGPTEREAINKQLELERERMRNEFSKGLDYANNDGSGLDEFMKGKNGKKLNCCLRCLRTS